MLVKRGRVWSTRIMIQNRLYQKSLKTRDRKEASKREHAFVTDILRGDFDLSKQGGVPRLHEFKERLFNALSLKVAPRTCEFYKTAWKPLADFIPIATMRLDKIDSAIIEQFIQARSQTCATSTVNHSLRTLRRALRLAEEWKLIRRAPRIKLLAGEHTRDFVIDEPLLVRILAHEKCTPFLRDLVPFLLDSGLRLSEALALEWPDVDFKKREVFVRRGKSKAARRHVPMTARVHEILTRRYGARGDQVNVFPAASRHWPSEQFRAVRDAMGLPADACIHSCRHTFLTRLGASGCDVWSLMKLAGHSSVVQSQKYVHPSSDRFASAIAGIEPVSADQ